MISGSCAEKIKGMISYPCCPKNKVMAYASARGRVSTKCPNCGKFVVFDYDLMTAEIGEPARGATHRFKKN